MMNQEDGYRIASRMQSAADTASVAADRNEQAAHRIACLLEDGYGGNGLRLIEQLEKLNTAEAAIKALMKRKLPNENLPSERKAQAALCSSDVLGGWITTQIKSMQTEKCAWCGTKINLACCCGVDDVPLMREMQMTDKLWCSLICREKSMTKAIMNALHNPPNGQELSHAANGKRTL